MSDIPFFDSQAAFAMRMDQLFTNLYEQMEDGLEFRGLKLRGTVTGTVQTLYHAGPKSVSALAAEMKLSHQLATQRVKLLVDQGFAQIDPDPDDKRRKLVSLTDAGRLQGEKLQAFLPELMAAYDDLFAEIGVDMHAAVLAATKALQKRSLLDRFDSDDDQQGTMDDNVPLYLK